MLRVTANYGDIKPLFRHAEEAFRLKCYPDLCMSGMFPNVKEITESMGAWKALRRGWLREKFHPGNENIACFVVGDGSSPRTGALVAHMTRWDVHSIDPNMKQAYAQGTGIRRLNAYRESIEDFLDGFWGALKEKFGKPVPADVLAEAHPLVILCVHSHAPLAHPTIPNLRSIQGLYCALPSAVLVSIPCCVRQEMPAVGSPLMEYADTGIWSPQNRVKVWAKWEGKGTVA